MRVLALVISLLLSTSANSEPNGSYCPKDAFDGYEHLADKAKSALSLRSYANSGRFPANRPVRLKVFVSEVEGEWYFHSNFRTHVSSFGYAKYFGKQPDLKIALDELMFNLSGELPKHVTWVLDEGVSETYLAENSGLSLKTTWYFVSAPKKRRIKGDGNECSEPMVEWDQIKDGCAAKDRFQPQLIAPHSFQELTTRYRVEEERDSFPEIPPTFQIQIENIRRQLEKKIEAVKFCGFRQTPPGGIALTERGHS